MASNMSMPAWMCHFSMKSNHSFIALFFKQICDIIERYFTTHSLHVSVARQQDGFAQSRDVVRAEHPSHVQRWRVRGGVVGASGGTTRRYRHREGDRGRPPESVWGEMTFVKSCVKTTTLLSSSSFDIGVEWMYNRTSVLHPLFTIVA